MVLQQGTPASVWGWADAGEKVTVKFGGRTVEAVADENCHWKVKLQGFAAGEPAEMTIAGKNILTLKNVVAGEVWVASGQSNMEFRESQTRDAAEETKAANFPTIRMFTVQKNPQLEPAEDVTGKWEVCTPETVPGFSAVGYFFARHLSQTLKQPIGIIHTSVGGTPAEFWTPKPVLAADPAYQGSFDAWAHAVAAYPQAMEKYEKDLAAWKELIKSPPPEGQKHPPQPALPRGGDAYGSPGCLYNGMIAPPRRLPDPRRDLSVPGRGHVKQPDLYKKLFPTMIKSWRHAWQSEEFPFLFVQLANFMQRHEQPVDTFWARLREAQLQTLAVPHTGMAVIIDIGEEKNIHPRNKQDVGLRLALWAEATVYGRDEEYSGPLPGGVQIEDRQSGA